jgi:hypothetical protein
MKTLLFWCLIALLVGLPIYLLYWNLFRAALIQRLKYRMFQVRDDLRMLLIAGEISEKEKAYPLIEKFCNRALSKMEDVDLTNLLSSKLDKQTSLEVERDLEIIFNSGPDMRRHFLQIAFLVFGAAAANSPGVLVLIAPVIVFSVTALWFNKVKLWFLALMKKAMGNLFLKPASC